jgi:hypothetical protein
MLSAGLSPRVRESPAIDGGARRRDMASAEPRGPGRAWSERHGDSGRHRLRSGVGARGLPVVPSTIGRPAVADTRPPLAGQLNHACVAAMPAARIVDLGRTATDVASGKNPKLIDRPYKSRSWVPEYQSGRRGPAARCAASHASTSAACRGSPSDMTWAPADVTSTSSSMRIPIPRNSAGTSSSSGWK